MLRQGKGQQLPEALTKKPSHMTSMSQAKMLKDIDLLVSTGLGPAPIAPALCGLLFKIMGAEAGGMCWFSESGVPEGFYQQGSSLEIEELFMNHYEELFFGPHEYTPFWSIRNQGRGIGKGWQAGKEYLRSNTFNLLIKPSHFHFLLDAVVDIAGVPRLTACFFRTAQNPFTEADAKKLTALIPVLRRISSNHANPLIVQSKTIESGHMLISSDGTSVEMIDAPAERVLSSVRLFDQNVAAIRRFSKPPKFIQLLCDQLRLPNTSSARQEIAMAGGTLAVTAKWLASAPRITPTPFANDMSIIAGSDKKILVAVHFKPAGAIDVVHGISALGLSPLQGRIAMYAAAGGSRTNCAVHHRVSNEALKKHMREILSAARCSDWHELTAMLRSGKVLA